MSLRSVHVEAKNAELTRRSGRAGRAVRVASDPDRGLSLTFQLHGGCRRALDEPGLSVGSRFHLRNDPVAGVASS